ncbi:LLM class flavin-dependent oxidoreductase [Saccharopolyspora phatthalungensis]|uniref:5,10-methylenetetrahydromethanopterin reductase n=1 Tax=Saccharopolyspora phatthalungensis TaxID=664693 RepID=A0A840QID1_9PSEU|nr:LLM class flavin-dependent oxidoreductase [Saccharopolyspora phatthalungensis]MBB5158469.1 5,10-methylenetetrahydromethanopterin reductase [Saccharopolyspora phatthalungensis]
MRTSIRVNNDLSDEELTQLVLAAEAVGVDQVWISHDLMLRSAPVLVGALAARTERIQLGIGIMNPYTVHPTEIAMVAATAQEISGGRFLLGLGAGAIDFLAWAGLERRRPMTTTRQSVAALRALLGHDDVSEEDLPDWWGESSFLRFAIPRPVPVYVGAMGPQMRRLAGRVADGALPLLSRPEMFTEARGDVLAGVHDSGRDAARFDLPACVWVSLGDRAEARRVMAEKLAYYGPSLSEVQLAPAGLEPADFQPAADLARAGDLDAAVALIDDRMLSLGIAGSPDEVTARCLELRALGAEHISFGPPLGPDPATAIELLGREVIPALRAAR